jgi:hypothetical protein
MDASPEILVSIPDFINEAYQQIAEEVRFPELKKIASVTTSISTYFVNMPTGFSSRLVYAGNSDGEYKILDGGVEELLRLYPSLDESGDIEYLLLEGSILYYQPIPTVATAITCVGYFAPATLVNDTDTPSVIPDYLQREALINKAASLAYNIIEDESDGNTGKLNTKLFTGLAGNGVIKIKEWVSRRRPVTSSSVWSY